MHISDGDPNTIAVGSNVTLDLIFNFLPTKLSQLFLHLSVSLQSSETVVRYTETIRGWPGCRCCKMYTHNLSKRVQQDCLRFSLLVPTCSWLVEIVDLTLFFVLFCITYLRSPLLSVVLRTLATTACKIRINDHNQIFCYFLLRSYFSPSRVSLPRGEYSVFICAVVCATAPASGVLLCAGRCADWVFVLHLYFTHYRRRSCPASGTTCLHGGASSSHLAKSPADNLPCYHLLLACLCLVVVHLAIALPLLFVCLIKLSFGNHPCFLVTDGSLLRPNIFTDNNLSSSLWRHDDRDNSTTGVSVYGCLCESLFVSQCGSLSANFKAPSLPVGAVQQEVN